MSDQRARVCARCGHDRVTHHRDARGEGDCLARCDCRRFVDPAIVADTLAPPKESP